MTPPASGMAPAVLPLFGASAPDKPSAIFDAAQALLRFLEKGRALDARTLRNVAIAPKNFSPHAPSWRGTFVRLQERGRMVFTCAIDGGAYARHGASVPTRLIVIDKAPADDPQAFPQCAGNAANAVELLDLVEAHVPPRQQCGSNATQDEQASSFGMLFRSGAQARHQSVDCPARPASSTSVPMPKCAPRPSSAA